MNPSNRVIAVLLALQVASTVFLWTLDALDQISEAIFALFVGVDLMAFAMVSYTYRANKRGGSASKSWMLVGCVIMLILVFSSLLAI